MTTVLVQMAVLSVQRNSVVIYVVVGNTNKIVAHQCRRERTGFGGAGRQGMREKNREMEKGERDGRKEERVGIQNEERRRGRRREKWVGESRRECEKGDYNSIPP